MMVRVLSYNLWFGGSVRKADLSAYCSLFDHYDIIGIQENHSWTVGTHTDADGTTKKLRRNTAEEAARQLGFNYVEQGNNTAIITRFPVVSVLYPTAEIDHWQQHTDIHPIDAARANERMNGLRSSIPSTADPIGCIVRLPQSGLLVRVYNAHFIHTPYGPYQLCGTAYGQGELCRVLIDPATLNDNNISSNSSSNRRKTSAEEEEEDYWRRRVEHTVVQCNDMARRAALAAFLSSIDRPAEAKLPTIFTGDFNEPSMLDWTDAVFADNRRVPLPVRWPLSATLIGRHGFVDGYRQAHPDPVASPGVTWTAAEELVEKEPRLDRIDFVMLRGFPANAVASAETVRPTFLSATTKQITSLSDHAAVAITLRLSPLTFDPSTSAAKL